jgi:hypothetical protein
VEVGVNKKGHVLNGVLLSIGLGYVLEPSGSLQTFVTIAELVVPITLGALLPDIDTAFGKHRKTFHNLITLGIFMLFPLYFANLYWVWVGVLTHFVLDMLGSRRGIALFYPLWTAEFGSPSGVTTSSKYANLVTLIVTALEITGAAVWVHVIPGLIDKTLRIVPISGLSGNVTMAVGSLPLPV